jgi:hypothetical protein
MRINYEYVIAHRGACNCVNYFEYDDRAAANDNCRMCDYDNGYSVPLELEDGRIIGHYSCAIERSVEVAA